MGSSKTDLVVLILLAAVQFLGIIPPVSTTGAEVDDLIKALDSPDHGHRRIAMERLGELGRDALPAVPRLIDFLRGDEMDILRKSLREMDADYRSFLDAEVALAAIGEPEVVEQLLQSTKGKAPVRVGVLVDTLSMIDHPKGIAKLKEVADGQDVRVRRIAIEALVANDYATLVKAVEDRDLGIRRLAVNHTHRHPPDRALTVLRRAAQDSDSSVRRDVVRQLGGMSDSRAVDVLLIAAQDSDREIRYEAVSALGKFRAARSVPTLIVALKDKFFMVRSAAARVMGTIADPRVVEPLRAATKDENSSVRRRAEASLGNVAKTLRGTG